jgi:Tfp pilus assembly protein PilE
MKSILNISPSQNELQGAFPENGEVLVMCDAADASFAILMPDAQSTETVTFRFVKKDASANTITLQAKPNQKIMNEDTQVLTQQADELVLNADGENWW